MTGDIWSTGAFAVESPLKDLLDSGNYSLEQLLAEDELLQELRGLHPQLLDYFSTEEVVTSLVRYLILDPNKDTLPKPVSESTPATQRIEGALVGETKGKAEEEKESDEEQKTEEKPKEPGKWLFQHLEERTGDKEKHPEANPDNKFIRFPYMACEIICCEIQGVLNVLVDGFLPPGQASNPEHGGDIQQRNEQQESQTIASTSGEEKLTEVPPQSQPTDDGEQQPKQPQESRQRILDLLFSVLYDAKVGELDDYRAGYLEKILSVLFRTRPQAMSEYMNTGGGKGSVTMMTAMFQHLYSNSIMQLVQRLLLPQPLHLQQKAANNIDDGEDDDDDDDGNLILSAESAAILAGDADDETKTLQCNWSESGVALDMLLGPLFDSYASSSSAMEAVESTTATLSEDEEEQRLNLCQNISEVLITIIQNSPLNSDVMLRLTVDPMMEKLVDGASRLKEGEDFSPHESPLTATMNVLESLILQLGGYGSVGTISLLPTEENGGLTDEQSGEPSDPPQFADLKALLAHIPRLLESLSILLRHPSCDTWRSPMQFSKTTEPQLLLGMSRLRIVRLLESLVLLGESNVDALLCQSDCLEICLDLFWKFQWCSMLHQSVANLLVHVFEGANARSEMQEYFLVKCNLLGRLMDSFAEEMHTGEHGFGLRNGAPIPDFTEQEVVIAMKNMKLDVENAAMNAPQPNDLGARTDDGDRVPSDDIIPVSDDDVDAVLEQQVEQQEAANVAAAALADLATGEGLPAKELDAAISVGQVSTEAVRYESRDGSTVGAMLDGAPAQSFRLGYMGHVIIICQALVHACSTENEEEPDSAPDSVGEEDEDDPLQALLDESRGLPARLNGAHGPMSGDEQPTPQSKPAEKPAGDIPAGRDDGESSRGLDSSAEGVPPPNPLILSKLIDGHQLRSRWQDFVKSTLSTETAIQSTPLGGFNNNPLPGGDPLHAHRPLGDGEDFDDGSGQPSMPPRGMLGGGDVIDMDDNDLDIAATMMAGLHLARGANDDDDGDDDDDDDDSDDDESGGSGNTYEENPGKGGYFFEDPLGRKRESGLEKGLLKLGQYHADSDEENDEGSNEASDHSSDEEGEAKPSAHVRRTSSGDEVPVMNLFAGNFGEDEKPTATETSCGSPFDDNVWSNFANFDDAFAGAPAQNSEAVAFTADFGAAEIANAPSDEDPFTSSSTGTSDEMNDIFGAPAPHAILLDEPANTPPATKEESDPSVADDEKPEDTAIAAAESPNEEQPEGPGG